MYIERAISRKLRALASKFPVVFLTGPRQSGKSTLLRRVFSGHEYVNLEEADTRRFAQEDPRGFLGAYGDHAVIDEAQRAPALFSYIQTRVDEKDKGGMYILSGSQNFLMMRNISQSLAGRVGILTLLPLSLAELPARRKKSLSADRWMHMGAYPRLFSSDIEPADYYPSYISAYVERDVRQETGVHDLARFRAFLRVCAARTGEPVNFTDIGKEISADARTVASWISVLEESYITFRLQPWYRNLGKRQTRTPKLYFHDTGLLCSLLGMDDEDSLHMHDMRGHIFENAVISELAKVWHNSGKVPPFYFWRAGGDREIDLIIERSDALELVEIKSGETAIPKHVRNIRAFATDYVTARTEGRVVYDGPDGLRVGGVPFANWRSLWGSARK
ncbi:MAG: ATP-binding protein [Clostridiales Family XIII bacterium]|nr:ATP-binding protein [Clostridiales Family XIII bacterium]